ncbi:SH2 domain-containing protein 1B [Pristis pectinata]|uniref:SH2 domain-containing protein 1B n=1 Tax=Pristis pectinata TaxID=685728 RepID=UPI00223E3D08|nr:SH2 domain-containing protein 1B [Pristis pectinata]XP_051869314.1 SH2 domain-containing protein 1B [Pristis pectinata]XP_051869315.1 SH2 domain-containing protein 1B [Pristis pectinata]
MSAVASLPYFHGNISKKDCETLFEAYGTNGSYLVRQSETIPDALCLSIFFDKTVYTYRIFKDRRGRFMIQSGNGTKEKFFKRLTDLIDYYEKPGKGLVTHLCYPLQRNKAKKEDEGCSNNVYEEVDDADYVEVLP